ncbi:MULTISPECIES: SIMPL domain-containing protein [Curvivirga]|uniref:SIMPL domain-containing protein n=1 Tax=Curvivirga TaxID=2856846 RepID=UPI0012BD04F5|nr:SIMPL domain-containing protein [Curvivirga aplysinae]MTI10917.1 SIMPL domain-containing protein [Curvivirga aplysinae]
MSKPNQTGFIFLGLFLALGITLGGYFIGQTMYNAKVALNTAEAKGLAEKRVKADRANWTIIFRNAGYKSEDIPALYKKSEENQKTIINLLKQNGFDESEIKLGVIDYSYMEYRDDNQNLVDERHQLTGSIDVETDKVDLVSTVRSSINKLITQGIDIENYAPRYYFTKLNEIKPEMLKEATQNARIAANEFASNAGANVGRIRNARQGGFIVRDAGEEYGDTAKIEKDIRIVTTITFYLTD